MYWAKTLCVGDTGLWHRVWRNISICAVLRSVCWILTTHGGCLNIHTTTVLLWQFSNAVLWISTHCQTPNCHSHECIVKKTDDLPHLAFVIPTQFKLTEKTEKEKFSRNTMNETGAAARWLAQQFCIIKWNLFSSTYEEEQMVEASRLSFYSLLSNDPQRRWGCLLVISQRERVMQKQLVDKGSHDLWDKLIRQCLQCYAAHNENVMQPVGSLLSVLYNDKTNRWSLSKWWIWEWKKSFMHSCFQTNRW